MNNLVFVFGSNEGGIHGAGAAKVAYKEHGARWGMSYGHYGNSFAIPTKGVIIGFKGLQSVGSTLELSLIRRYVDGFCAYANGHPELEFQVTAIGCGLAGLYDQEVAPMFRGFEHTGMKFDTKWQRYLQANAKFWGTYDG